VARHGPLEPKYHGGPRHVPVARAGRGEDNAPLSGQMARVENELAGSAAKQHDLTVQVVR